MRKLLFVLSALFFLFSTQAVSAKITVRYFFNPPWRVPNIEKVRNRWSNKVNWIGYNASKSLKPFERYSIYSLPVAIVECDNQTKRIQSLPHSTKVKTDNKTLEFYKILDQTIAKCYTQKIDLTIPLLLMLGIVALWAAIPQLRRWIP